MTALIRTEEAARRLGIPVRMLRRLAKQRPPIIKPIRVAPKLFLWHWESLDAAFKAISTPVINGRK